MKTELKSKCCGVVFVLINSEPQCIKCGKVVEVEPQSETPRANSLRKSVGLAACPESYLIQEYEKIERELGEAKQWMAGEEYNSAFQSAKEMKLAIDGYRINITQLQQELAQVRGELETAQLNLETTGRVVLARDVFIAELAKQNHKMREAFQKLLLELSPQSFTAEEEYEAVNKFLKEMVLQPDLSSLTVLTRTEVESWRCHCYKALRNQNPHSAIITTIKCPRCTILERFTK